jgi:HK97 family phage portal protein
MNKEIRIFGLKVFESRSESQNLGTLSTPSQALMDALGGVSVDAGVKATTETSLTLSAVWRAINLLSGTIAGLPLRTYHQNADNSRDTIMDHSAQRLLRRPNAMMTDFQFKETMQALLLLYGNAFAVIRRDTTTGFPTELIIAHPDDVYVYRQDDSLFYIVRVFNESFTVASKDMIHLKGLSFNGLTGKSPISVMRESMGLTIAAQKFGAKFFGNGAQLNGVLEVATQLSDVAYERLRQSWDNKYSGPDNGGKTAILEGGTKYNRIGIPPEDAQFLQTRQFQIAEIARWFGVQPHLLMDLERATNNNIEKQGVEFVTFTLTPWISRWESELNRKLFTSAEFGVNYMEFNLNGLLRGDAASRAAFYQSMFAVGGLSPNEIRKFENQAAYDGGDQRFVQAGYAPINLIDEFYKSKQNTTTP